jgi:hypothetical protein
MVARFVLPWFGGTSLVWTTCMLFFQVVLVLGYAWSHFITRRLSPRQQWLVQVVLLAVAMVMLPVRPDEYWKPSDGHMATLRVLGLLAACIGLPFFLVSTTGPLMQAWQSVTHPARSPFRLFALSNAASLLALLTYPLFYERYLPLDAQSWAWSAGFLLYGLLVFWTGWQFSRTASRLPEPLQVATSEIADGDAKSGLESVGEALSFMRVALWLILPMLASVILLSSTNMMTQEVGAIPFLWVLPLSLYLLSFIICFDHQRWYARLLFFPGFFVAATFSAILLYVGVDAPISMQVLGYSAVVFGGSMCCHGELARLKPHPRHLTFFYLVISIGGALGGAFVALAAPRLFINYYEFPLAVLLAIVMTVFAFGFQVWGDNRQRRMSNLALARFAIVLFLGVLAGGATGVSLLAMYEDDTADTVIAQRRNEYGTLTVHQYESPDYRKLTNGRIEHGWQYMLPMWSRQPTSYYSPTSGVGVAVEYLRQSGARSPAGDSISFGVIGLGVGTICGWAERGDYICYYDINPQVVEISQTYFTYLRDCPAPVDIRLGDARLQLERELLEGTGRQYDLLIADAFSSDSIPIHLLTVEALEIYRKRLTDRGIMAIHTSNRFLELANIVRGIADHLGMHAVFIDDDPEDDNFNASSWVLVTNDEEFVRVMEADGLAAEWPGEGRTAFWTDDFSSIIPIVKWETGEGWWTDFLDMLAEATGQTDETDE